MTITFARLALTVAVSALLSPAVASAGVRPDDRAGIHGVGATPTRIGSFPRPDDRAGPRGADATLQRTGAHARPNDRAGIRGAGPDAFMRAVGIHAGHPQTRGSGFAWAWVYWPVSALLAALALVGVVLGSARARRAAVHV